MRRSRAVSSTRSLISRAPMPWHFSGKPMFWPHIHMRIEREQLEHEGDVALGGAPERDVLAVEQDPARGRQLEARRSCAASSSCRSRTGRARQKNAPSSTVKLEFLHRDEIAEGLVQILDADLGHARLYSGKWLTMTKSSVPARMVTND